MAFFALKSGEWEEYFHTFRNEVKVTEWAFDRIKEAFEKVAKDEARKLSTVQEIMIRSTDYLQRIVAPAGGARRSYDVIFPMEDYVWWVSGEKSIQIGGAQSVEKNTTVEATKQALGGANKRKCQQDKVFRAHAGQGLQSAGI